MANSTHTSESERSRAAASRLREVWRVFVQLGLTAFGGPVAHVAAMQDELVRRRQWVSAEELADLLSAANVIPGPNSTELAIHLGYRRAGWPGLLVAGAAFIVPSTLMVWGIAMAYVTYGQRAEVGAILAGMQPVVLAVVAQALFRLARGVLTSARLLLISALCVAALFFGWHELVVLALGAALSVLSLRLASAQNASVSSIVAVAPVAVSRTLPANLPVELPDNASGWSRTSSAVVTAAVALASQLPTTAKIFFTFAKIGSVLFGSGYVLLAFMRSDLVLRHHWLTEQQLLDAIAIGQVTPGPVFTSATFVGYLLNGHLGALAATFGIFLPAFVFVAVSGPWVRQVRRSARAAAALDGLNAASLALMLHVIVQMIPPVASSWSGRIIFLGAGALLLRTSLGAGWLLMGGALVGVMTVVLHSVGVL